MPRIENGSFSRLRPRQRDSSDRCRRSSKCSTREPGGSWFHRRIGLRLLPVTYRNSALLSSRSKDGAGVNSDRGVSRVLIVHSRYLSGHSSGENRVVDDEIALLRDAGYAVSTLIREVDASRGRIALGADVIWNRDAMRQFNAASASQPAAHRSFSQRLSSGVPCASPCRLGCRRARGRHTSQLPLPLPRRNAAQGSKGLRGLPRTSSVERRPSRVLPGFAGTERRARLIALGSSHAGHAGKGLSVSGPVRVCPVETRRGWFPGSSVACPAQLRPSCSGHPHVPRGVFSLPGETVTGEGAPGASSSLAGRRKARRRWRWPRASKVGAVGTVWGRVPWGTRAVRGAPAVCRRACSRHAVGVLRGIASSDSRGLLSRGTGSRERHGRASGTRAARRQRTAVAHGQRRRVASGRRPVARPGRVAEAGRRRTRSLAGGVFSRPRPREPGRCVPRGDEQARLPARLKRFAVTPTTVRLGAPHPPAQLRDADIRWVRRSYSDERAHRGLRSLSRDLTQTGGGRGGCDGAARRLRCARG